MGHDVSSRGAGRGVCAQVIVCCLVRSLNFKASLLTKIGKQITTSIMVISRKFLFRSFSPLVILGAGFLLAACNATPRDGAFDLTTGKTGAVDSKGFPVFVGARYERDVPLKRTIERARLEAELEAIAESRKSTDIDVGQRRSQILQARLKEIARTHGARAEAEIAAACTTDQNGIVTCKSD